MVKILSWNCRGIGNTPTKSILAHFLRVHSPDILFLSEPKAPLDSQNPSAFQSFGFNLSFSNHNSSLWCLCNSNSKYTFTLSDFSNQHISIYLVDPYSSIAGLVTSVYGFTDYRTRRALWEYLVNTSSTILPWTVIGNFNSILLAQEKWSIRPLSPISENSMI